MLSHEEAIERDWKTPYVLGELPEPERDRFEEHFFDCPTCSEDVKTAYLLLRGVEATLKHPIFATEVEPEAEEVPSVPERKPAPPMRSARPKWSWAIQALPYAAILCLSLGAGVQHFALQKALSPRMVVAYDIQPQAKGSTQKIVLPAAGEFVELKFDLIVVAPQYNWEIKPAGADRAVMSGEARPPAGAVLLQLVVPSSRLHPGRWEATLFVPPGNKTVYPFEVIEEPGRNGAP